MSWIKFMTWTAVLYGIYYAIIILIDISLKNKAPKDNTSDELTFVPDEHPIQTVAGDDAEDPVIFSGGQTLQQIFSLAREEVIEYTRPVSF